MGKGRLQKTLKGVLRAGLAALIVWTWKGRDQKLETTVTPLVTREVSRAEKVRGGLPHCHPVKILG